MNVYLAIDLGAGSGRIIAVSFDGEITQLEQVHRFGSPAIEQNGSLFWYIHHIWSEIGKAKHAKGIKTAVHRRGVSFIVEVNWG